MNALRARPQQRFLLQRSTILSFCAAKTTQALIHLPIKMFCVLANAALAFWLFHKHLSALCPHCSSSKRIQPARFIFPQRTTVFLLRNSFLAMQRNWCSLDWLSANSSAQYAFQPRVRKLPKKANPRKRCRPREKGARGWDLPPKFPSTLCLHEIIRASGFLNDVFLHSSGDVSPGSTTERQ